MVITDKMIGDMSRRKPVQEAGVGIPVALRPASRPTDYVEPGGEGIPRVAVPGVPGPRPVSAAALAEIESRRKPRKPVQEAGASVPVALRPADRPAGYEEPGMQDILSARTPGVPGPRSVSMAALKIAPEVIRARIEGIIKRTGISMPQINIRQEAHEIDIPGIVIELPKKIPAPVVCEARLVKRPDMVAIDKKFDFEFSVKNCGDAAGDFEIVVVLSKTGVVDTSRCLAEPVAQLYESGISNQSYGVIPPHKLCGPDATYPMFKTILWGVMPGETKQATVTCWVGKEFTGRPKLNVRAWARLISPPQPGSATWEA